MKDLELIRRAAKIAGNTKCWIGVGCVIAKNGKVLSEAWNKTLDGEEYCREFRKGVTLPGKVTPYQANQGCIRHELKLSGGREPQLVCSIHAEINAIAGVARKGIKIDGADMFVTSFPCLICMRAIIASGIKRIFYMNDFYKPHHLEMLEKNGVKVGKIEL
jgi:deoxycytidylate deaminase